MKVLFTLALCVVLIGCGSRNSGPSAESSVDGSQTPVPTPSDPRDSGWSQFQTTIEPSRSEPVQSPAPVQRTGPATSGVAGVATSRAGNDHASAVADVAIRRFESCCADLPEREDLGLVLRTALRSVATPDFDAYHDLMTARGCTLLDAVDEECRDRWDFIDFGYSKAAWEELPLTEKARAYWNTLDEQKKRWLAVDLSSVRVGTDPKAIPRKGEGMIMSYSFYRPPGGFEPFLESAAPVALVHFDLTVPKGVAPLTFCFTFDVERRKWYPWWTLVQHSNAGPACKIRF